MYVCFFINLMPRFKLRVVDVVLPLSLSLHFIQQHSAFIVAIFRALDLSVVILRLSYLGFFERSQKVPLCGFSSIEPLATESKRIC